MGRRHDVVVIGAGVAGLSTARSAARRGLSVVVLEKKREIGVPLKCAGFFPSVKEMKGLLPEATGFYELLSFGKEVDGHVCHRLEAVLSSGRTVAFDLEGVSVNRTALDKLLATEAAKSGATIMLDTEALELSEGCVFAKVEGKRTRMEGKVIIGADGAFSRIAAYCGVEHAVDELAPCYAHEYCNSDANPDTVKMYLDSRVSPGGFGWLVPRGDLVNVGLGFRKSFESQGLSIREYYKRLVSSHDLKQVLRSAQPISRISAHVPVGGPRRHTVVGNVMLVGDAAGQVLAHVGSGVPTSIIAGEIAGSIASDHVLKGKPLEDYERSWRKVMGRPLRSSLRIRKILDRLVKSDRLLEKAVGLVGEETYAEMLRARIPRGAISVLSKLLGS